MLQKSVPARLSRLLGIGLAFLACAAPAHAAGDAAAGKKKAAVCAACHGPDGNAVGSFPKLAGQHENYLVAQLEAFKSGKRTDEGGLMAGLAKSLSQKEIEDLAAYFASQEIKPGAATSEELVKRGERIYRGGNAKMGVSACMSCHGPSGHGIPPRFPKISGQNPAYTEKQLLAFRADKRQSDSEIMTRIAQRMTEAEIKAVSEYMAGLH